MAATDALKTCSHCGLPIRGGEKVSGPIFCCHACQLVALIIGSREEGNHAWNLLKLGLSTLLAMNIMMLSLLLYTHAVEPETIPVFRWVMLLLAAPAMGIMLYPLVKGAVQQCLQRKAGLDLLIVAGSLAAFTVSAVNTAQGVGEVFFDTATMLPVLVTFGKLIEATAKRKAADLLNAMESLLPASALKIYNGCPVEVPLDHLQPGDLVRVRVGERIAVDGLIVEGTTTIEEAAFTGEPLPRGKRPGDRVLAGTVNGEGSVVVLTEQVGQEVLLQRVIAMIHSAWKKPSPSERLAERAAAMLIPAVGLIAAASLSIWSLSGNPLLGCFSALSVLVVACPCTMGIATPLATSLAVARAAAAGVIVRGGEAMEFLGRTDLIFFDKTGTVTTNQPVLTRIIRRDPLLSEDMMLSVVATLESAGGHPLARAIATEANKRGIAAGCLSNFRIIPGQGISGLIKLQGRDVAVTASAPVATNGDRLEELNGVAVDLAWGGAIRGRLLFEDRVRDDAHRAVTVLADQGVDAVLLSGDRLQSATAIATQAGIEKVEAPRNPVEKLEAVQNAIAAGKMVAMVGDGINDAAALIAAPVGIAVGSGLELARQAGNVVILSDRLVQIPWLIGLSRQTRKIIGQNFAWSFAYNAIALGAAAAGLLHPLLAAVAMVGSSLTVLTNSLRISRFPLEDAPCLKTES